MAKQWGFTYGLPYGVSCPWVSDITEEEEEIIKNAIKEGISLEDVEELQPLLDRALEEVCEWELAEYPENYVGEDEDLIDSTMIEFCDPNIDDYGALKDVGFDDFLWEDFSKYFAEEDEE